MNAARIPHNSPTTMSGQTITTTPGGVTSALSAISPWGDSRPDFTSFGPRASHRRCSGVHFAVGGKRIVRQRKPHPPISEDQALANARPLGSVEEVKPVERQASSLIGETVPAVRPDQSPK
jgi:hypothetical protein